MLKEITNIFKSNTVEDLKRIIIQRATLNRYNQSFSYLFYFLQTSGVYLTSFGQSKTDQSIIWCGIGCTTLATLIHLIIVYNTKLSKGLLSNLDAIKSGNYIDEGAISSSNSSII